MASIIQEVAVNQEEQHFSKIRGFSNSHSYIIIPIPVLKAIKPLDCISRCLWITLYELGYFGGGGSTIALADLASMLSISKSSLETKIAGLIQNGFLIKKHNFDEVKHQYLASTFYVRLPDDTIETIAQQPTRKDVLNDIGRYITKGLEKDLPISAPIKEIKEQVHKSEAEEIRIAKLEAQSKLEELEKTAHVGLPHKVKIMEQKAKLKSLSEKEEKNLATELPTPAPNHKDGAPNRWVSYINNSRKIDIINNNKQALTDAATAKTNIQRLSTGNCSFATQEVRGEKAGKGYRNTAVELPEKIKAKIQKAVYDSKTVSNPDEVLAEGVFAVSRCFTGVSLDHAANTFCKLLRQEKWTTPIPLRMAKQGGCA